MIDIAEKINCNDIIDLPNLLISFEKTLLKKAYGIHRTKSGVAKFLGLSKQQVLDRLKKYQISVSKDTTI